MIMFLKTQKYSQTHKYIHALVNICMCTNLDAPPQAHTYTHMLKTCMLENEYVHTYKKPTKITTKTSTLIDHVYTRSISL